MTFFALLLILAGIAIALFGGAPAYAAGLLGATLVAVGAFLLVSERKLRRRL